MMGLKVEIGRRDKTRLFNEFPLKPNQVDFAENFNQKSKAE